MTENSPVLFLLEDSNKLTDSISRIARRHGWNVAPARSLEGAHELCAELDHVDAAIIDLMVPEKQEHLEPLDDLLQRRFDRSNELTVFRPSSEETRNAREEAKLALEAIDDEIREIVVNDGGIRFMASDCGQRLFAGDGVAVAVSTSRRADTRHRDGTETLEESVNNARNGLPTDWFENPVPPVVLIEWLEKVKKS